MGGVSGWGRWEWIDWDTRAKHGLWSSRQGWQCGTTRLSGEREFHERARGIIRGAGGSNLRVYVHSFTGGEDQCEGWIRNFPRVVFGVGKLAAREGLGRWVVGRTDRVVLETDAPYLGVKREGRLHSPFMVREWVGWLCRAWNLPRRVVTMILERNVARLYQLGRK